MRIRGFRGRIHAISLTMIASAMIPVALGLAADSAATLAWWQDAQLQGSHSLAARAEAMRADGKPRPTTYFAR